MSNIQIISSGKYIPEIKITNEELEKKYQVEENYIFKRTGIKQRFYANEEIEQLAIKASKEALQNIKENIDLIKENLQKLEIDAEIYKSNIFEEIENATSPCYLCARKRRGFLYAKAQELGCNKIALGHHFDDVIETIMLNIIYAGEYKTMLPKLKSTNFKNMELIRPLYYIKEKDIISWKHHCKLNFLDCACNVTKKSIGKRKEIKQMIENLRKIDKNIDIHIFKSSENVNLDGILGYKKNGEVHSFTEDY